MARQRPFIQCDVFTSTPTKGNALAVVLDGSGLSDDEMAAFAAWTNLAETTFIVLPENPDADYGLRIFTPTREMLFAGHPTLGSCAAWLHTGGTPQQAGVVRQECGIGLVDILLDGDAPAFVAPPTTLQPLAEADKNRLMSKLSLEDHQIIDCARLDNGPVWQVFHLTSAADVLAVDSASVKWPDEKAIGLIGAHAEGSECQFEVRMLAPSSGMSEDPITGSLNAALACWFRERDLLPESMIVSQGTNIDRVGRVFIANRNDQLLIGGHTHILIEGTVTL